MRLAARAHKQQRVRYCLQQCGASRTQIFGGRGRSPLERFIMDYHPLAPMRVEVVVRLQEIGMHGRERCRLGVVNASGCERRTVGSRQDWTSLSRSLTKCSRREFTALCPMAPAASCTEPSVAPALRKSSAACS